MKNICENYDATSLQQMYKLVTDKDKGGLKDKDIFPVSIIQAIFDGKTGIRLDHILSLFNHINVPFKGTNEATRLIIQKDIRRKGLILSFTNYDNITKTQRYINNDTIADEAWKDNSNWEDCFVSFNNIDFINEIKDSIKTYVDNRIKELIPPEGYEYILVKKED